MEYTEANPAPKQKEVKYFFAKSTEKWYFVQRLEYTEANPAPKQKGEKYV